MTGQWVILGILETLNPEQCTVYMNTVHFRLYSVQFTVHSIQCRVYSVQ